MRRLSLITSKRVVNCLTKEKSKMDPSTIHLLISASLAIAGSIGAWLLKSFVSRVKDLEKELAAHKLEDAIQLAQLNTKSDELFRRLDGIDAKLDRILERP